MAAQKHFSGNPIATYRVNPFNRLLLILVGLGIGGFLLIGGVSFLFFGLAGTRTQQQGAILFFIVGGVMAVAGLALLWWSLLSQSFHVKLYRDGFTYHRAGRVDVRWQDIAYVWRNITKFYNRLTIFGAAHYGGMTLDYIIQLKNGKKLSFQGWMRKGQELGDTILEKSTGELLPQAIEQYRRGAVVDFPPSLGVSQRGIVNKSKKILVWDDTHSIVVKEGYLTVRKMGKKKGEVWLRCRAGAVANIIVLFTLLQQEIKFPITIGDVAVRKEL